MIKKLRVSVEKLKNKLDLSKYKFKTTDDLEVKTEVIGQNRGVESLKFGLSIKRKEYNIYISGESGTGRLNYSQLLTSNYAKKQKTSNDLCYVYNFEEPEKPKILKFKAGDGKKFKGHIEETIEDIKKKSNDIFYSDIYEDKKDYIYEYYKEETEEIITELNEKAELYDFVFEKIDEGLVSVPVIDGKILSDKEVEELPESEVKIIKAKSSKLESETINIIKKFKQVEDNMNEEISSIERDIVIELVREKLELNLKLEELVYNSDVELYTNQVIEDIKENVDEFIIDDVEDKYIKTILERNNLTDDFFKRYKVNLFIDNSDLKGAPVINEISPSFYNLFGKIEHYNEMGYLKTDHMRIKSGAIHRANGGYLLVNAKDLLSSPRAFERLKKCIITERSRIENISRQNIIEESIAPEDIPLDVKVMLIGEEYIYQVLYNNDDDFKELFKIKVDFDNEMDRNEENIEKTIHFINRYIKKENMKTFTKSAVGEIIEYSSRVIENQNKLTTKFSNILELMYEGDAWASLLESKVVDAPHIGRAIDEKIYRNNKYEEKFQEMICTGRLMIDINEKKIGEINGLAVIDTGEYAFGKPTKITASTFAGKDGIVNIQREVGQSSESHDKGVFILNGFIGEEFSRIRPLSLTASITFEQCYGRIDGDSASSTELYALLSSIGGIPINQGIATTGSVNQKGMIQPIGGVNEKIEGFFKVCKSKGLTGKQGVIIPFQNIENLILSEPVIKAVNEDLFNIYGVHDVKEGIEILTDTPYGVRDKNGEFKEGTIGYSIDKNLKEYELYYEDK